MIHDDLKHLARPIKDLKLLPGNPRRGNVDAVKRSYDQFGQRKPIVATRDGTVIAGNHQLKAARELGWEQIAVVWVDDDPLTAKAFALADNRVGDLGSYDDIDLANMLREVAVEPALLESTGYDIFQLEDILKTLTTSEDNARDIIDNADAAGDSTLKHNIDVFYNASPILAKISTAMGFAPGIISRAVSPRYLEVIKVLSLDINFVDNEFKDYDHQHHVSAVRSLSPRYATVRDIMTKKQCETAEIEYYSFDDILDMASEVNDYAENVIIIPKYDCLDKIPDKFMLGYSIPTAYGATPIDIKKFRGRRVHLLGGNWKRQRNALGLLGESVVSLDNNHLMNIGRFGLCYAPDGSSKEVANVMPGVYGNVVPMMVSMSAIIGDLSRSGVTINGRNFRSKETGIDQSISADFDVDITTAVMRGDEQEGFDDE
jgi:hypothetical protein